MANRLKQYSTLALSVAVLVHSAGAGAAGLTTVSTVVETGDDIPNAQGATFVTASAFAFSDNGDALVAGLGDNGQFYFSRVNRQENVTNLFSQISTFPAGVTSISPPLDFPERIEYSAGTISFSANYQDTVARSGHFFINEAGGTASVVPDDALTAPFFGASIPVNATAEHSFQNGSIYFHQEGPQVTITGGSQVDANGWLVADSSSASFIASNQTELVGDPAGATLVASGPSAVTNPPAVDGATIAFYAKKRPPAAENAIVVSRSGVLSTLVDETDALPGGTGTFSDFTTSPASGLSLIDVDDGDVAFVAHGVNDQAGNLQGGLYVAGADSSIVRRLGYEQRVPRFVASLDITFGDGTIGDLRFVDDKIGFVWSILLFGNVYTAFYISNPDGTIDRVIDVLDDGLNDDDFSDIELADFDGGSFLIRVTEQLPGGPGTVAVIADFARDRDNDRISDDQEIAAGTDPDDANDPRAMAGNAPNIALFASVLPNSRSVANGQVATIFGSLINAGTVSAENCTVLPTTNIAADFSFQQTNPSTNAVIGAPNTAVDLAPNAQASFLLTFNMTGAFNPTDVALSYRCAGARDAPQFARLNSVSLESRTGPGPDMVALAATPTNDGIVRIGGSGQTGIFSVASVNVADASNISVQATRSNSSVPVTVSMCQTNPATGACINPTVPTTAPVELTVNGLDTPTFGVFVQANSTIALDPANTRIFVEFLTAGGRLAGLTSVAVATN